MPDNSAQGCIDALGILTRQYAAQHDIVECFEAKRDPTPEQLTVFNARSMDRCGAVVARVIGRNNDAGEEEMTVNEILLEAAAALAKDLQSRIESVFSTARRPKEMPGPRS
jgi:hypothetical protein